MLGWLLSIMHVVGLALGTGSATAKMFLLARSRPDHASVSVYLAVARPITWLIIAGLVLLTASGLAWLVLGYDITPRLVVKLALVAVIWMLGPIIDNRIEPRFRQQAPTPGVPVSTAFLQARKQYLAAEVVATLLFYVVIVYWMAR